MNPEVKALWLADLRSGKLQQARGALHRTLGNTVDSYCCLGVLCRIAESKEICESEPEANFKSYDREIYMLPLSVVNWADLTESDPLVLNASLSHLNDEFELTFDQIADLIERFL